MAHQKCSNSLCLILPTLYPWVIYVPPSNMIDPLQVLCSLCQTCSQSWKSWVGIFLHWVKLTCTDDPISGQPRLSPNRNMSHSTTSPTPPILACCLLVAAACTHSGKREALTNAIRYNFKQLQEQPKIQVPQQSLYCNQLQSLKTAITENCNHQLLYRLPSWIIYSLTRWLNPGKMSSPLEPSSYITRFSAKSSIVQDFSEHGALSLSMLQLADSDSLYFALWHCSELDELPKPLLDVSLPPKNIRELFRYHTSTNMHKRQAYLKMPLFCKLSTECI